MYKGDWNFDFGERMSDDDDESSSFNRSMPPGERLVAVEVKIGQLQNDTKVMRAALHGVNGEMQKFVIQEERCVNSLEAIKDQTKHLPDIVATVHELRKIQPALEVLLEKSRERSGAWKTWVGMGSGLVGAIGIITGLILAILEIIKFKT